MNTRAHEQKDPDCLWESGQLGLSEDHAVAAPPEHSRAVDEALGLHLISIRLPMQLIADLKEIAQREGLGYQPLIRRVLVRFVGAEFKSIAREELMKDGPTRSSDVDDDPCEAPRVAAAGGM